MFPSCVLSQTSRQQSKLAVWQAKSYQAEAGSSRVRFALAFSSRTRAEQKLRHSFYLKQLSWFAC